MQKEQRVEIIDMLRGWALLIVVISNYLYFVNIIIFIRPNFKE